jgi:hypothetical protein
LLITAFMAAAAPTTSKKVTIEKSEEQLGVRT